MSQLLGFLATAYGVFAALAALLQARQMLTRRASCDVSARFFAAYAGGYAIWLLYGLSVSNIPLIVVDSVGLLCGGLTLAVALSLRGSLLRPASWASCDQSEPVQQKASIAYTSQSSPRAREKTQHRDSTKWARTVSFESPYAVAVLQARAGGFRMIYDFGSAIVVARTPRTARGRRRHRGRRG